MPPVHISSYQKIVDGKVVNVNAYQVHRDAGSRALVHPGRPMIFAKAGQFPGGRSTPNIYPIPTHHGAPGGTVASDAKTATEAVARAGGKIAPGAGSNADSAGRKLERIAANAAEKAALVAYTGKRYREIQAAAAKVHLNSTVQSEFHGRQADPIALVAHLDNLVGRAFIKTGTTAYKVAQITSAPTFSPGTVIKVPSFSSTIPSQQLAQDLAAGTNAAVMAVSIPAGAHVLRAGDISKPAGDELILPRNSQFRIVSDETVDGTRRLQTEFIQPPDNVVTQQEASQTTERAFAALKRKQQQNASNQK